MIRIPALLEHAYREGKVALLVGSGLSCGPDIGGRFPRWIDIPERLLTDAREYFHLEDEEMKVVRAAIPVARGTAALLAKLDELKEHLGHAYGSALRVLFDPINATPGKAQQAVIATGVKLVMTTNYDRLLEFAADGRHGVYTWRTARDAVLEMRRGTPVIYKLHGSVTEVDSIILTRREYDVLAHDEAYKQSLRHILGGWSLLMVGYGNQDPFDLDVTLNQMCKTMGPAAQRHFILYKRDEAHNDDIERWKHQYNVYPILYESHDEVSQILRRLRNIT